MQDKNSILGFTYKLHCFKAQKTEMKKCVSLPRHKRDADHLRFLLKKPFQTLL